MTVRSNDLNAPVFLNLNPNTAIGTNFGKPEFRYITENEASKAFVVSRVNPDFGILTRNGLREKIVFHEDYLEGSIRGAYLAFKAQYIPVSLEARTLSPIQLEIDEYYNVLAKTINSLVFFANDQAGQINLIKTVSISPGSNRKGDTLKIIIHPSNVIDFNYKKAYSQITQRTVSFSLGMMVKVTPGTSRNIIKNSFIVEVIGFEEFFPVSTL